MKHDELIERLMRNRLTFGMTVDEYVAECEQQRAEAADRIVEQAADLAALREALANAERYMTEQGVSHEYPVMFNARKALADTEPAMDDLTPEELDAIERAVAMASGTTTLQADLRGILDRHRPKPTLPDILYVTIDDPMKLAAKTPSAALGSFCTSKPADRPSYPIYPNPSVMIDPVTLSVEHGLTVERYSVCFRIYSSERRQLRGDFPLSRDGYHAALRKATEIASQRKADHD